MSADEEAAQREQIYLISDLDNPGSSLQLRQPRGACWSSQVITSTWTPSPWDSAATDGLCPSSRRQGSLTYELPAGCWAAKG